MRRDCCVIGGNDVLLFIVYQRKHRGIESQEKRNHERSRKHQQEMMTPMSQDSLQCLEVTSFSLCLFRHTLLSCDSCDFKTLCGDLLLEYVRLAIYGRHLETIQIRYSPFLVVHVSFGAILCYPWLGFLSHGICHPIVVSHISFFCKLSNSPAQVQSIVSGVHRAVSEIWHILLSCMKVLIASWWRKRKIIEGHWNLLK